MENKTGLPDPLAPWSEKIKDPYGLSVGQLISKEWFNGTTIDDDCEYGSRRDWIRAKRKLARGEQDTSQYKEHLSRTEGDLEYLNLDWTPINIVGKFARTVSGGISDNYYTLDIRANDRHTVMNKKKKMDEHRKNMRSLPLLKKTKEMLGIDLMPKGFVPEDEEELALITEIKNRPIIEEAEEITIDYVKKTNDWKNIEDQKNIDLANIGITAARIWTEPSNGVMMEYTDSEFLVHSHVNKNDFSDAYYFGVVDSPTIHDIQRESGFDDLTIRKIAELYGEGSGLSNYDSCEIGDLFGIKTNVLRFAFKTNKKSVYKAYKRKGKTTKLAKRDESFETKERSDYKKLEGSKDVWMEGTFVIGSEFVYNYQPSENIIRDEQNKPRPPFIVRATDIYKNKLHSFTDDIEPLANQMQYTHLKIQHLIAELKPDLIEVDFDALADLGVDIKGKKQDKWETALNMMGVKGVIFKKRIDMGEMGMKEGNAVQPKSSQQGSGLTVLLNVWAHYYNLIRETTGISQARDGSLPHDALLGVNEMAQLASNTITSHIVDASVDFNKKVCETISSRIGRIFTSKNSKHLRKLYERAVGKQNVDALESMKNRDLHDFGFTAEMIPTQQEIKDFKEDLALALQDGSIDVEIKAEAQQAAKINLSYAHRYLFYMRKKRRKELMEDEAKMSKVKSQNDIQASQAAKQAEVQAYATKTQIDLKAKGQEMQMEVMKLQAVQQIEAPVKDKEFKQEVFLKQMEVASNFNAKKYDNDRKDDRTKIQASQQSKMKHQASKEGAPPIDFEDNIFKDIFSTN